MIKFNKKLKLATAAFGTAALASFSVLAETATFDATATILEALTVTNNTNLNFASIVPDAAAGTVAIDVAGARTCAANLTCTGTTSAADFTVVGTANSTYTVTLPADANIASGANTMLVDNFVSSLTGETGTLISGTDSFQLGATLNVGANQATGTYAGTFTVTVEYN